jgi:hypothetical protein
VAELSLRRRGLGARHCGAGWAQQEHRGRPRGWLGCNEAEARRAHLAIEPPAILRGNWDYSGRKEA